MAVLAIDFDGERDFSINVAVTVIVLREMTIDAVPVEDRTATATIFHMASG